MFLVDNLYHKVPFHFVTADVRLKGFPIGKIQNFNICCFALPAGTVLVYRSLVDSRRRSVILGSPSHGQEIDGESGAAAQAVIPERFRHCRGDRGG